MNPGRGHEKNGEETEREVYTLETWSICGETLLIYDDGNLGNTKNQPNVGLMLGQRYRRWLNIKPTLGRCIVFAEESHTVPASTRHRPNVGPMLGQRRRRWTNIGPTLGRCLVLAGIRLMRCWVMLCWC